MVRMRPGVLDRLKAAGYSSYRMRKEKILGQRIIQQIREGRAVSGETLNLLCYLLNCQPGDVLEYIPDDKPNKKTLAAFKELDSGGGTHFSGSTDDLFDEILSGDDDGGDDA